MSIMVPCGVCSLSWPHCSCLAVGEEHGVRADRVRFVERLGMLQWVVVVKSKMSVQICLNSNVSSMSSFYSVAITSVGYRFFIYCSHM
jgi:hypothetical protein